MQSLRTVTRADFLQPALRPYGQTWQAAQNPETAGGKDELESVSAQQVERLPVRKFSHMTLAAIAVWSRTTAFGSGRPDAEFDHAARPTTSEVYGDPSVHPQSEDYWGHVNPVGPRLRYDEGKRCAETLFFDYWRQHRLPIKVARIFNTYGPRMHPNDGRVVSNFIVQALLGRDITIYGDGSRTRSFFYVDMQISRIRLSDKTSRLRPRHVVPKWACSLDGYASRGYRSGEYWKSR
jgi:hypothetical protein